MCEFVLATVLALPVLLGAFWKRGWERRLRSRNVSESELTAIVAEAIVSIHSDASVMPMGDLDLSVVTPDGQTRRVMLASLFENLADDERERVEQVRTVASLSVRGETELCPEMADRVLPVVRNEEFIREVEKVEGAITEPLVGELWVTYAVDESHRVAYLQADQLGRLDLTTGTMREKAIENLEQLLTRISVMDGQFIKLISLDGTYESSLMLADSLWTAIETRAEGPIVVAVPVRDAVAYVETDDPESIRRLRVFVDEVLKKASYPITRQLFRRSQGRWSVF